MAKPIQYCKFKKKKKENDKLGCQVPGGQSIKGNRVSCMISIGKCKASSS